jgi:hypothetical protein
MHADFLLVYFANTIDANNAIHSIQVQWVRTVGIDHPKKRSWNKPENRNRNSDFHRKGAKTPRKTRISLKI